MTRRPTHYPRHRFPAEVIGHAVRLYLRFTMSFRDIEDLLASRGPDVGDETIRQWRPKFGQTYANALRRRQPRRGDKWHLDDDQAVVTARRPGGFSANCSRDCNTALGC